MEAIHIIIPEVIFCILQVPNMVIARAIVNHPGLSSLPPAILTPNRIITLSRITTLSPTTIPNLAMPDTPTYNPPTTPTYNLAMSDTLILNHTIIPNLHMVVLVCVITHIVMKVDCPLLHLEEVTKKLAVTVAVMVIDGISLF